MKLANSLFFEITLKPAQTVLQGNRLANVGTGGPSLRPG
jgi:hypothetical protein